MNEINFFQETYEAFKEVISRKDLNRATRDRVIRHASKRFGLAESVAKELQEYYNGKNLEDFLRLFIQRVREEGIMLVDRKLNIMPMEIVYEIPNTGVLPKAKVPETPKKDVVQREIPNMKKEQTEPLLSHNDQKSAVPHQSPQKEVKKVILKTLKHIDISELSNEKKEIAKEKIDKFIKQLCMEGITLNEVEITDNGKSINDLKYMEIHEKIENRLKEISSKLRGINSFNYRKIYGDDVIRVFRWVLGKGKKPQEIYQDIKARQNKVINCDPERIIRVQETFRNDNDGLDLCTMIFTIERLKAIITNHHHYYKIANNNSYKEDKNKVEGFFNKLFGIEVEKKSEPMER